MQDSSWQRRFQNIYIRTGLVQRVRGGQDYFFKPYKDPLLLQIKHWAIETYTICKNNGGREKWRYSAVHPVISSDTPPPISVLLLAIQKKCNLSDLAISLPSGTKLQRTLQCHTTRPDSTLDRTTFGGHQCPYISEGLPWYRGPWPATNLSIAIINLLKAPLQSQGRGTLHRRISRR